ncbi:MAG: amidohydrolase family protein [Anaerolineae bacterium]
MIMDCHTHIFPPEFIAQRERYLAKDRWFGLLYESPKARMATGEDLVAEMDQSGVDVSVTFGFAWSDMALCQENNDYVLDACRRYPGRLVGFGCVQPRAGREAVREVERCLAEGMAGIGELMPDGQGFDLDDARVMGPVVAALVEAGAPLMVHTSEPVGHDYCGKGTVMPGTVYNFARMYPELTLICSHWGGGLPFYELMPEVRKALARVCYDTAASPLLYDDRIFPLLVGMMPDKVLFGTDYPLLRQRPFVERVRESGLDREAQALVLGQNALRVLGVLAEERRKR